MAPKTFRDPRFRYPRNRKRSQSSESSDIGEFWNCRVPRLESWVSRIEIFGILFRKFRVPRLEKSEILNPRFENFEIVNPRFENFEILNPKFENFEIREIRYLRIKWFEGSKIREFRDARIPRFENSEIRKQKKPQRIPRFEIGKFRIRKIRDWVFCVLLCVDIREFRKFQEFLIKWLLAPSAFHLDVWLREKLSLIDSTFVVCGQESKTSYYLVSIRLKFCFCCFKRSKNKWLISLQ